MASLGLYVLFVLVLLNTGLLLWLARHLRLRLQAQDQKIAENLEDLDLAQFQEDVSGILTELARASETMVKKTSEREKALGKASDKARLLEKKLSSKTHEMESRLDKISGTIDLLEARFAERGSEASDSAPTRPFRVLESENDEAMGGGEMFGAAENSIPEENEDQEPETPLLSGEPKGGRADGIRKVRDLAEEGLNAEQISKSLGMLKGEVELILRLVPKRK
jgi:signal transduction histidine kinase